MSTKQDKTPRPSPEVAPMQDEPEKMAFDALRKILLRDYGAGEAAYYLGFLTGLEKQLSRLKAVPAVAPRETQGELPVKEVVDAFDPFRRIFEINKQLKPDDNTPFIRFLPGVWPTWGDFKRLVAAMKRLENGGR